MTRTKTAYLAIFVIVLVALGVTLLAAATTGQSAPSSALTDAVMQDTGEAGTDTGAHSDGVVTWDPRGEYDSGGILQLDDSDGDD